MADEPTTPATGAEPEPTTPPAQPPETPPEPQTPEGLGDAGKAALEAERKARRDAEKARKALEARVKEFEDADKSDQEKLEQRATKAETTVTELETKLARFEVAAEKKLPSELAEFLTGTKEEMAAKADVLLERLKTDSSTTQVPGFDGGARDTPPPEKAPEAAHNEFLLGLLGKGPAPQSK